MLINKCNETDLEHFNDSKAFFEYLNGMHDTHKNIEEYNLNKKLKTLPTFDGMITDMVIGKRSLIKL